MKNLLLILGIIASINSYALTTSIYSAARAQNETGLQALNNTLKLILKLRLKHYIMRSMTQDTPYNLAVPFSQVNYSNVPALASYDELLKVFYAIRDDRFITDSAASSLSVRRIPWQYPNDYCWARAGMADIYSGEQGLTRPVPIFVFGNLSAKSINTQNPDGIVYWFWHVAPMLAVNNIYYVLDPALNPNSPLKVDDWYKLMNDSGLKAVVCNTYTYYLDDSCLDPIPNARESEIRTDVTYAMSAEIENFNVLFMGSTPPWQWSSPRTFGPLK